MSEMVERVAKEIHYEMCSTGIGSLSMCSWPPSDQKRAAAVRKIARAAIKAMRKPTRRMLSAGGFYHIQGAGSVSETDMEIAKREWQAMISEALKD